ncbi:MAG TPA: sigma-70 family RNA polymerase sigma factor [Candidatus Blautia merdipullorum]|nr:sigma-70 family RNA polymerase sigma factor [Candidatus Blautia merdipullorum]
MPLNDNKLILQIQRGNRRCADELVERYYSSILRYCSWHCYNTDRAEDLTQETFLRVFRDIYMYEQKGSFNAYLYTIAHHLCIDENRKLITFELDKDLPMKDDRLQQVEDREQIKHLLKLLTPVQREVILLHCGEQLSFREIAQILDIPARTAQSRFRAAITILRKEKRYLPQEFGYYPNYTAKDFLLYISALKGIPRHIALKRSSSLLDTVSLTNVADKKIKTFSGGMKQRLGIAQALLNNPKILVLDEPTAGLDPKERVRFRNILSEFANDKIVLLSTHIVSDIEAIADQVFLMKKGSFVLQGSVEELVAHARGNVWELTIQEQEMKKWELNYTVANLRHSDRGLATLRIISDQCPSSEAVSCEPSLEDLYLLYFPTEEGG